jgi:pimeloyl-ACP methyl ester carboxylesterase
MIVLELGVGMTMNRRAALRFGAAGGAALIGAAASNPALAAGQPRPDGPLSDAALVRSLPGDFRDGFAAVNGTTLHYVIGGEGTPLVLLPGWPETWWEFRKIMPELARHFRVIAVDLRGMNSSGKPAAGYDKKTMAEDIHQLVRQLGYDRVDVAGHDIGSMVAFSFAANHPEAVRRLSMLDVAHPDPSLYQLTMLPRPGGSPVFLWWFAFNQVRVLPEQLLTGRFRHLTDYLCETLLINQAAIDDHTRGLRQRLRQPRRDPRRQRLVPDLRAGHRRRAGVPGADPAGAGHVLAGQSLARPVAARSGPRCRTGADRQQRALPRRGTARSGRREPDPLLHRLTLRSVAAGIVAGDDGVQPVGAIRCAA